MPTKTQLLQQAIAAAQRVIDTSQASVLYEDFCAELRAVLVKCGFLESLKQLVEQGPVEDGDVISKSQRDWLISFGVATRVCVKGEQGFTAANYVGYNVFKANIVPYKEPPGMR